MTRLSNRQYPMLRSFAEARRDFAMSVDQARAFDQRPFRSMLIQGWITYRRDVGFFITEEGAKAWREFLNTDIARKDPTKPLTAFFDPAKYGLRRQRRKAA